MGQFIQEYVLGYKICSKINIKPKYRLEIEKKIRFDFRGILVLKAQF